MHTTEKDIQAEMLDVLQALGWVFVARKEMNDLRGTARMNEAIVEPLLVDGIRKLNPELDEDAAREVAALVRRINTDREMLNVLRRGVQYKRAPDQPTLDMTIVDSRDPSRNSYVVTEELALRTGGQREPRLDVVCLVNGIPLGAIENKNTEQPLESAADDWRGYWADVPQLAAQLAVAGCCNGLKFRVGPSGAGELGRYHHWSDAWPLTAEDPDDEMLVGLTGAFAPHALVDLAVNFMVFETREGITTKKLARAHQYRAANKLVDRVLAGEFDRGIIWHATGSGKSLTMVFAARKLRRVGLGDPTVLLVIDRTELDEQINETLTACEFDDIQRPGSRKRLAALLTAGGGGVIVVTMHKFDASMAGLLRRGEVIAFVDEAHRTQFGDFGVFMRSALPSAKLFGFTGTPIELDSKRSTRKVFSPRLDDGSFESYLDRYGFDQAIADGATVPVVYEPRLAQWRLSRTDLDARFDVLTAGLSEEERDALREQAAREKVIAKAPDRVSAVAADLAAQLRDRIAASGFGALYVGVDREACALMAEGLTRHLQPDEYAVVMSRSKKDSAPRPGHVDLRRWHPAVAWERVHGRPLEEDAADDPDGDAEEVREVVETEDEFFAATDRAAIKDYVRRVKRVNDPLKLLIVNAMLLTGFDAPPVQALALDRGLRGHTLMQAISRTNRRYPNKDAGLVLDYWGVFDDLKSALHEFAASDLAGLAEDSDALIARLPGILDKALDLVAGAPPGSARRRMLWVVRHLTDHPKQAEEFEQAVRDAQSVYETLSPDPRLLAHMARYRELMEVWYSWVRGSRRDRLGSDELRHKTRLLVQESVGMDRLRDDLPAATIDAEFLTKLNEDQTLTPEEKATDIEAALVHETVVRGEDDPRARALAERLARLRRRREREAQMTLEGLKEWEELVRDHVAENQHAERLGLDEAGMLALAVLRRAAPTASDGQLLDVARGMSDAYRATAGFDGWSDRADVVAGLRRAAVAALVKHPDTRRLARDGQVTDDLLAGLATIDRRPT
jgi:type I restriction enzyme, R subunit